MRAAESEGQATGADPTPLDRSAPKPSGSADPDLNEPTEVVHDNSTGGDEGAPLAFAPSMPLGLREEELAVIDDDTGLAVIEDGASPSTLRKPSVEESASPTPGLDSEVRWKRPGRGYAFMKRTLDLLFVTACAPMWVPMYGVISLLILVFDGRPIHYTERRVGRDGRGFTCLKFRSMHQLASAAGGAIVGAPDASRFVKAPDDPRRTRLGRLLRRSSLDELPQLLNVLVGHMSLVGPRPVTSGEVTRYYGPNAPLILSIRPGLSGLWQVSGRSLLSVESRTQLELRYVLEQSLRTDATILIKTVPAVIRGHGAF